MIESCKAIWLISAFEAELLPEEDAEIWDFEEQEMQNMLIKNSI